MIRGIQASRNGMAYEQLRTEVVADNIANLNTVGFRRSIAIAAEADQMRLERFSGAPSQSSGPVGTLGTGSVLEAVVQDLSSNMLEQTGRPLDVALIGQGEFVFEGPNGPGYTRSGNFHRDGTGRLVTAEGYPVLVGGAPVGAGAADLQIGTDGTVFADGEAVGRLDVRGADVVELAVGSLERPQVKLADEMAELTIALRSYQANQRALQMQDETLARAVSEIGKL